METISNEVRELLLRILLGSKEPLTRGEIIEILDAYTNVHHPRTTVYDNLRALSLENIVEKSQKPNISGRMGRPFVIWKIKDYDKARKLLSQLD